MTDTQENVTSSAATDAANEAGTTKSVAASTAKKNGKSKKASTAEAPELHVATLEATVLEHNSSVGQPTVPDGTTTGHKPPKSEVSPSEYVGSNDVLVESAAIPDRQFSKGGKNLTIIDPNTKLGSGYTDSERDELSKMYDQTFNTLKANEIIIGKIVALTPSEATIDIGFKSEGVVPRSEFNNATELKLGDEVEVFLETLEDKEGRLILSRRRAEFIRVWEKIVEAHRTGEVMQAKCERRIKGGMVVNLMSVEAFLPGSQIDVKPVRDFDAFIGQTLDVRIVKINFPNENVVVSHKVLLEEHLSEQRKDIVEKLERGQILEGTVKAIADFGAFVDLGGVDGLVHITDLSWGRVNHPTEIIHLDQTVTVVVLDFDENKKRISLGMKQLTPHPWAEIEDRYKVGTTITGKVVSITDYGAFVELEKGIEGLIHISEMSWTQHIKHPSQLLQMGTDIEAMILNIDQDAKKISLGLKQLEPDPWTMFLQKYPIGSRHRGIVRNLTNFGAFVELEPGVDGLVHISDLSWTKKVRHPGEVLKKNEEIDIMILGIDLDNRRISLGHKQVLENPWENLETVYGEGMDTEGRIVRIIDKGVIVELPKGVDGFVPVSQLALYPIKNIGDSFKIDDTLNLRIIEFDIENRKIVLSATEWLKVQDRTALEEFNAKHPIPKETLEELQKRRDEQRGEKGKKKGDDDDFSVLIANAPSAQELGTFELPEEMFETSDIDVTDEGKSETVDSIEATESPETSGDAETENS